MVRRPVPTLAALVLAFTSWAWSPSATYAATYQPGELDPTFNADGVAVVAFGNGTSLGAGVAVRGDGSVLLAGFSGTADRLLLTRLTPAGRLDPTFSGDGRVSLPLPIFEVTGLALQNDGRAVVSAVGPDGAFIVRFTEEGLLDTTFSRNGVVRIAFDWQPFAEVLEDVAIGPGGTVLAAGRVFNAVTGTAKVLVVKLASNGNFVPGFGDQGVLSEDLGTPLDWIRGLAVADDGSVLAAGIMGTIDRSQPFVVRYDATGSRDPTFGGSGLVRETRFGGPGGYMSVAIMPNGSSVAVGTTLSAGDDVWAVGRYSATGEPATGFDGDGLATVGFESFGSGAIGASAQDIVRERAGRLIVGGTAGSFAALVRMSGAGRLDPTFGAGGKVVSRLGASEALGGSVALAPGRRIVLGGSVASFPRPIRMAAARFRR